MSKIFKSFEAKSPLALIKSSMGQIMTNFGHNSQKKGPKSDVSLAKN
jgi:hypothetical protein